MRRKAIVLGDVPLATYVIKHIIESKNIELAGVVCQKQPVERFDHHGDIHPPSFIYCKKHSIPVLTHDEAIRIAEGEDILGFAVRYPKIIKPDFFSRFNPGIINFHGGELPRYRGQNIANQVILDGVERSGATLHFIDEGVDTGNIVERVFFPISPRATAAEVFYRTSQGLKDCFLNLLFKIERDEPIPFIAQKDLIARGEITKTYSGQCITSKKCLTTENIDEVELDTVARAFAFPGHEPAYIIQNNRRIHLIPEDTEH